MHNQANILGKSLHLEKKDEKVIEKRAIVEEKLKKKSESTISSLRDWLEYYWDILRQSKIEWYKISYENLIWMEK